jgi:hypothetical protein
LAALVRFALGQLAEFGLRVFLVLYGVLSDRGSIDAHLAGVVSHLLRRCRATSPAEYGLPGESEPLIPPITQETLADMIGTTRSRVSFFMNRFRKLGLIEYNGRIRVHKSLLNLILHDKLPEQNAVKPPIEDLPSRHSRPSRHA